MSDKSSERKKQLAEDGNENTLIEDELETLYSHFQKGRVAALGEGVKEEDRIHLAETWAGEEQKATKLRREENKVRALNKNGRVDYCIQE